MQAVLNWLQGKRFLSRQEVREDRQRQKGGSHTIGRKDLENDTDAQSTTPSNDADDEHQVAHK